MTVKNTTIIEYVIDIFLLNENAILPFIRTDHEKEQSHNDRLYTSFETEI